MNKRVALYISLSLLLIVLTGCSTMKPEMPWEDPAYSQDIPATTPDSRAVERAKGGWNAFIRHHENRKKWVTEKDVDLLMIGDSILFEYLRTARPVWEEFYEKRNGVNISSSGDRTSHMLWHIQDGGLDGMKDRNPKLVVVLLGTNNRGEPERKGQDTAAGILALLKEIHNRLPESKILLMALLPRGWSPDDKGRQRNIEINEIIKAYADNKTVFWLDTGDLFLDEEGNLSRELIKDSVHPSSKGYRVWAESMEPTIKKLMGE